MLFDPLICTDLQLICTLQITASQTLSTFEKHCKTRANQRKSLQITNEKTTLSCSAMPCETWSAKLVGRKAH